MFVERHNPAFQLRHIKASFAAPSYAPASCNCRGGSDESAERLQMTEGQHLVLVVDDDLAVRESLKFALELEGLEVHALGSGADLLAHPHLSQARCLVLDYYMPVMDGFGVLAQLKVRNSQLPVILITGHVNGALRRRAASAGVRHVVEKPLLDSALMESIQDVLGQAI
jgi:two-component system, LuxR family, response regulator FixJ